MQSPALVVIQTAFLGDLILSIPFFRALKKQYPQHRLILICKKGLGEFLQKESIIDGFYEVHKGNRLSYQNIREQLKTEKIDFVFCVHRSIRSLLFCFQLKAHKKIGFRSFLGSFVFTRQVVYEKKWPAPLRLFKMIDESGWPLQSRLRSEDWALLNTSNSEGVMPLLPQEFTFENQKHLGAEVLIEKKIALFPGSVWATKRWTSDGFRQLIQMFLAADYQVDLLGGPDEKSLCEQVAMGFEGVQVLAGKFSILESIQNLKKYVLVVANDSAATHMAAYQNVPCVTLFGPTTLSLGFRPWSDRARVVQVDDLKCRPCGLHGHDRCPLGHHHCMTKISAARVFQVCTNLLSQVSAIAASPKRSL